MDKFTGMINKQEVRVGNKVAVDNGRYIATILTIRQSVMDVMYVDKGPYAPPLPEDGIHGYASWAYEHAGPIPLTPEILEKIGFRKDDNDDLARLGVQYILDLPVKGECKNEIFFFFSAPGLKDVSFGEYTVNSAHGSNNIYHLHQLQNLYFALTGQEMELHL